MLCGHSVCTHACIMGKSWCKTDQTSMQIAQLKYTLEEYCKVKAAQPYSHDQVHDLPYCPAVNKPNLLRTRTDGHTYIHTYIFTGLIIHLGPAIDWRPILAELLSQWFARCCLTTAETRTAAALFTLNSWTLAWFTSVNSYKIRFRRPLTRTDW